MNDNTSIIIPSCETCRFKNDPTEANCWFVRIKEGREPKLCWEYSLYEPLFGYVKAIKQEHIKETDTGISTKDTSKDLPMNNEQSKTTFDRYSNNKTVNNDISNLYIKDSRIIHTKGMNFMGNWVEESGEVDSNIFDKMQAEYVPDRPIYTGAKAKKFKPFSIQCDINSEEDLDNLYEWIDLQN